MHTILNSTGLMTTLNTLGRHVSLRSIGLVLLAVCIPACGAQRARSSAPTEIAPDTTDKGAVDPALFGLWSERTTDPADFVIGPGDVLEISVPGLEEISKDTVRVGADGTIRIPFAGSLTVAGLTQRSATDHIRKVLARYMYDPDVQLFVQTYASRQVAVVGEVRTPGTFTLNGPNDSIRTLIERAGGFTPDAAQQVVLTPARHGDAVPCESSSSTDRPCSSDGTALNAVYSRGKHADPFDNSSGTLDSHAVNPGSFSIDLRPGTKGAGLALGLPVRPGDTIYVPQAGSATVVGWVQYPKPVKITPGLTVLGAVSATGGPLFAADLKSIQVIRQEPNGHNQVFTLDLRKVQTGEAEDVALRTNDIVDVSYSVAKLPGYALYYAAQSIFSWAPAALLVTGIP